MTGDMILSGQWYANHSYARQRNHYMALLLEELLQLTREDQELQEAYSALVSAKDAYEAERAMR